MRHRDEEETFRDHQSCCCCLSNSSDPLLSSELLVVVESGEKTVLLPWRTRPLLPGDARVEWMDWWDRKVHVFENGSDQPEEQNQFYSNRTKMNTYPLITGSLSLTLRDPTDGDRGIYTCSVYSKEGKILMERQVYLQVIVPQVEVEEGEESVLLPCRTRDKLPGDARVEWRDGENDTVHVYKSGSDPPEEQDEFYRKRTKMNEDPLRTGDLSLTLSFPTDKDSNIFTCRVYSKEGKILMRKQVQLKVKEHQVVVKEGEDSVTLPFKTTDLPGDTLVKWWDKKDNVVCVYENGKDQEEEPDKDYRGRTKMKDDPLTTGDLSLTLIKPTKKDSGRYYCGVYHQEIRRKATVHLIVKAVDEVDRPQNQPEDSGTRTTNQTPLLAEHAV